MRMLLFRGDFSWDGKQTHHGLICFCHFHQGDDARTIEAAKDKIERRLRFNGEGYASDDGYEAAVLIPFSCLDAGGNAMKFMDAYALFKQLGERMPDAIAMPFASSNELHLTVHDSDPYVKFFEI